MAAAVDVLAQARVKAHGEVRNTIFGYAARGVVDDAEGFNADVIVMGSRGRGDLAAVLRTARQGHWPQRAAVLVIHADDGSTADDQS